MKVRAKHEGDSSSYKLAKRLRQSGSIVEKILWKIVREQSKNKEVKFRYQHPIQPYVVDFVCLPARLIVEIDGASHDTAADIDRIHQNYLENQGFCVLRFTNDEVMKDACSVANSMIETAQVRQQERWTQTPPRIFSVRQKKFDPPARGG